MIKYFRKLIYKWECKLFPVDMEAMYVDQSFNLGYVSSFYTPYGIKGIDSGFAQRIMKLEEDPKKLKKEIKENPHLHKRIKRNLIFNLKNRI